MPARIAAGNSLTRFLKRGSDAGHGAVFRNIYGDARIEREVFGPDVRVVLAGPTKSLADVPDGVCAAAEGLRILRYRVTEADFARFPKLRAVCRMGVGYDVIDRRAAAER